MANPSRSHSRGRGRSRKRRPASRTAADATRESTQEKASAGRAPARARAKRDVRETQSLGERPRAPWHPLPLSELLILVGAVGVVVGLSRGISHGVAPLLAGIAAVMIGTIEVMLREHLSGYRSHTMILALLPVVAFHVAVVLIVGALTQVSKELSIGLLLPDAALGTLLFKLLRVRYKDARRERTFAGRR